MRCGGVPGRPAPLSASVSASIEQPQQTPTVTTVGALPSLRGVTIPLLEVMLNANTSSSVQVRGCSPGPAPGDPADARDAALRVDATRQRPSGVLISDSVRPQRDPSNA